MIDHGVRCDLAPMVKQVLESNIVDDGMKEKCP
jgi:hypothetical protein